jgi:hypothetical protein
MQRASRRNGGEPGLVAIVGDGRPSVFVRMIPQSVWNASSVNWTALQVVRGNWMKLVQVVTIVCTKEGSVISRRTHATSVSLMV